MAIIIKIKDISNGQVIVEKFNSMIMSKKIRTWLLDDEYDYTSVHEQWRNKAWFKVVKKTKDELVFGIVTSRRYPMTSELYAIYHGRFATTLLAQFDDLIEDFRITPDLSAEYDFYK